ncbi:MAG: hypothetical protein KDK23_08935 [Leptospiraceae bacterium]|nr:hypothetical protein [Leptospiraceae bacterium]
MKPYFTMLRLMTGLSSGALASVILMTTFLGLALALSIGLQLHLLWTLAALPLALSGPLFILWSLFEYQRYRSWQQRLPFAFEGEFASLHTMSSEVWHAASIDVQCTALEKRHLLKVREALVRFCARANREIYETRWGRINRWQLTSPASAEGQANSRIAWMIYRFLAGPLSTLVRKGVKVQRVVITLSATGNHIMPESDTMSQ